MALAHHEPVCHMQWMMEKCKDFDLKCYQFVQTLKCFCPCVLDCEGNTKHVVWQKMESGVLMSSVVFTRGWSPTPRANPWGSERPELWCTSPRCTGQLPHAHTPISASSEPINTGIHTNTHKHTLLIHGKHYQMHRWHKFGSEPSTQILDGKKKRCRPWDPSRDLLWPGWRPGRCSSTR